MRAHSGRRESFLVGQPVQEQTIIRSPALGSSRHTGPKDLQGFGHSQTGKNIKPIEAMDRITMPSALLSHILLAQDLRQKRVVIGHRGRSQKYIAT